MNFLINNSENGALNSEIKSYSQELKNKFIFVCNLSIFIVVYIITFEKNKNEDINFGNSLDKKSYNNIKFAIITRNCSICGLFSFYMVSLGCIHKYLLEGYIPIIDIKSFPNVINGFNTTKRNHWEFFFDQPYGYTLEEVLKNAKNITYIICSDCFPRPDENRMLLNWPIIQFWHNFSKKYLSIKKEIIALSNMVMYKLFKNSKNILGVLTRGTDYLSIKPQGHPIPPDIFDVIHDVKEMDNKYKYDFIFFSTEDEILREKFIKNVSKKVKQIRPKIKINYNYNTKNFLNYNENIIGNVEFNKIYLLNIIILSKCLDIITARCSGTSGIFVLTNGFRNVKIYDLGFY